jgi:hypothetical protein
MVNVFEEGSLNYLRAPKAIIYAIKLRFGYQTMSDKLDIEQQHEFLSFFEYVLKDQLLFGKFMDVLDNSEEMIYLAAEYGFPLERSAIKPGVARVLEILKKE